MPEFVYINGEVVPASGARIPAISNAALYGKGIFTTIAVVGSRPVFWEKHWNRLRRDTGKVGIDLSKFSEAKVHDAVRQMTEANGITDGRVRVTLFDGTPAGLWAVGGEQESGSLFAAAAGRREMPADFRLTVSPYRLNSASPLAGVKSCNYLEKQMALDEAKARGFDEAVQLNERGQIASACMANIFWLKEERLYTPSLGTGCLAGTTREFVMENVECEVTEDGPDSLAEAEAIFVTSAGLGIAAAAKFDGRHLPRSDHAIMRLLERN